MASSRSRTGLLQRVCHADHDGRFASGRHGGGYGERGPRVWGGGPMSATTNKQTGIDTSPWWERRADDIERLIGKYPQARSAIMGLFWMAQHERGHVADEDLDFIADKLGLTRGYVDS